MQEFSISESDLNKTGFSSSVDTMLPDVIRNWTVASNQMWWSQSFGKVFGAAPLTNSANYWFENIHPGDKKRIMDSVRDAFSMQQAEWSASYKIKKADNSYLDIEDTAYISYADNTPVQLVGFMKVSHSLPANKIVETQQIVSIALEASDSASFALVLRNKSLVYSPGFAKMLTGESDYPATRQIFLDHIHPDDISIRQQAYRLAEISGILTYEARFIWKDGSIHWIKILAKYVYDTLGKPLSITGISTDISEQRQAQMTIKASEMKFRNLIEQSPVACALYLGRELIIEFTNDAMIRIWGKGDTVQGKKLINALPELKGQPYVQILEHVYDSGQAYHAQSAPADVAVNGILSTYYFDISYTPLLDEDNHVYGILEMAINATERVTALHELQRSEQLYRDLSAELETRIQLRTSELNLANRELLSSNQSLEQFAYAASHDLQEPLRKVVTFGTRLASGYQNELDENGKFLILRMQDAAERMSSMIADLLIFSRLQVNHKAFAVVDLNHVIASVLSDLEIIIEDKQAVVEVQSLEPVWGDASQLTQLLLNLVSNALKYQPKGQVPYITILTIPVDLSELNQSVLAGHSYLKILVNDNGIGFDQKHVQRIFQMFQRLHGKSEYTGSGIGLALCNKVVQNHYGMLTAESEPGKGSCFMAYLPVPMA